MRALLEIACFSPEDAVVAAEVGADRIELCRNYEVGGLTPSLEDIAFVKERVEVPVFVMIRERAGGFVYSADELERMLVTSREALENGANGLVFGALTEDGRIDELAVQTMVEIAEPHPITFHRAYDEADDLFEALDALKRCGVARVLTSGRHLTAMEGVEVLAQLVERAGDDLTVILGGGVRAHNVEELIERTGAREAHSAARTDESRVDPAEVQRLVEAIVG